MQYQFSIRGITCNSCVEKITKLLKNQLNVQNLKFYNNNTQIVFEAVTDISIEKINKLLSTLGSYQVINTLTPLVSSKENISYKPIYILFGYLLIANLLIVAQQGLSIEKFMINFMASFFLVFSFFKILDLKGFANAYLSYDIIAKRFYYYGYIYPFIEFAFGFSYILFGHNLYLNIAVFIIMIISAIGVIKAKLSKQKFYCACVGTFLKVPLGNIAILEDITMVIMSFIMIVKLL